MIDEARKQEIIRLFAEKYRERVMADVEDFIRLTLDDIWDKPTDKNGVYNFKGSIR